MIVHVPPGAPPVVHLAATAVLIAHIAAGCVGLASGAVALTARKGGPIHRGSGTVFFIAILTMAAIGAAMAPLLPQRSSVVPGMFTSYLTLTAWLAVRRQGPVVRRLELTAPLIAIAAVALNLTWGLEARGSAKGIDGDGPAVFFMFAALAAFAAALDIRAFLIGHGVAPRRIARHVWRMCLALLITSASFFLGQQQVFPAALRGSTILFLPELAVIGLMVLWSIRVRSPRWRFSRGAPATLRPARAT